MNEIRQALDKRDEAAIRRIITENPGILVQRTPLEYARNRSVGETVDIVMSMYPVAFVTAAEKGDFSGLDKHDVPFSQLDHDGNSALILAASAGNCAAIKYLLKNGAADTTRLEASLKSIYAGLIPIDVSIETGNYDAALLLEKPDGRSCVIDALKSNDRDLAEHLLDGIETFTSDGFTPLSWSIVNERVSDALWLIEHGADVNVQDSTGISALMAASKHNLDDVCCALLKKGADPDYKQGGAIKLASTSEVTAVLHSAASMKYSYVTLPPASMVMSGSSVSGKITLHLRDAANKPATELCVASLGDEKLDIVTIDSLEGIYELHGSAPSTPGEYTVTVEPKNRMNIGIATAKMSVVPGASGPHSFIRGITHEQRSKIVAGSQVNFSFELYDSAGQRSSGDVAVGGDALSQSLTLTPHTDGHIIDASSFVRVKPGQATLDFLVNGQSAIGYPLDCTVVAAPTHSGACVAYGPGIIDTVAGDSTHFFIVAHDRFTNRRGMGNDVFSAHLVGVEHVAVDIEPSYELGTYHAKYSAPKSGEYKLYVNHVTAATGSNPIEGSPFDIVVHEAPPTEHREQGIHEWLRLNGLESLSSVFDREGVTLEWLPNLTDAHLREMGVKIGPRSKLMASIERLRHGHRQLHLDRYMEIGTIHQNQSIRIVEAIDQTTESHVVLKLFEHQGECETERKWLQKIHEHQDAGQYIVKLLAHGDRILVLERGEASLDQVVEGKAVDVDTLQWYAKSVCECVQFLHGINISHGDIKPSNIVLFYECGSKRPNIKLVDMLSMSTMDEPISTRHTPLYCSAPLAQCLLDIDLIPRNSSTDLWTLLPTDQTLDAWSLVATFIEFAIGRSRLSEVFGDITDTGALLKRIAKHNLTLPKFDNDAASEFFKFLAVGPESVDQLLTSTYLNV